MLYVVPTPLGNLKDITLRALETLRMVETILAEDTRHTLNLLRHHEIQGSMVSFHAHNEARRTAECVERLRAGAEIALVSDAGMPGISDPGTRLIRAVIEAELPYTVLPGPSATVTAAVASGFDLTRWSFHGFLPVKSGQRERMLRTALETPGTQLFFESPHRLLKTLTLLAEIAPDRPLCVSREISKTFEEHRQGVAATLVEHYTTKPPKGEITLVMAALSSKPKRDPDDP